MSRRTALRTAEAAAKEANAWLEETAVDALPFVCGTADERCREPGLYWRPMRTGDTDTDWVLGEAFARQAIEAAVAEREPYLMMWIMEGLVASGRFDALERGFVIGLTAAHFDQEGRR